MGVATWMFTVVPGYWPLVLMILIAGQASATFTLTNVAVVPEVFGRSRWIKALLLTTVLGTLASLVIKGTVIASWKQSDPSTWNLPFQIDAVILVGVGLAVLLLVREAPAAAFGAAEDRTERARPAMDELRDILAQPNAKVLVGGSLLFWSGVGSTGVRGHPVLPEGPPRRGQRPDRRRPGHRDPGVLHRHRPGRAPQPLADPHAAGRRRAAARRGAGRGAVLRHPPVAGGGAQLHRSTVHRGLPHRHGAAAPAAAAPGRAGWANGSGSCSPRSTCAA